MNQVIPFPVKNAPALPHQTAARLSPSEFAATKFALQAGDRAYTSSLDLHKWLADCQSGAATELPRETLKSLVDASRLTILAMGALNRDRALAEALCKWMNEEEARSNEH